jgi:hypothetical protein
MTIYDYLFLELNGAAAGRAAFLGSLRDARAAGRIAPLGAFVPQLGWGGAEIAVLGERSADTAGAGAAADAIAGMAQVVSCARFELTATLRPRTGDILRPGGIYVHRWFEIAAPSLEEFIALSAQAWPDFESRFDANIFGLFEVRAGGDVTADERRLLLITRYGSHGVWEASRDPSTAAMKTFARRAALTLRTRASSTLLAPV